MRRNHLQSLFVSLLTFVLAGGCVSSGLATSTVPANLPTSSPTSLAAPTATPRKPTRANPTQTSAPPTETPVILPHTTIDPSTLAGKLLMGYQGWFTCPGDGTTISNGYYTWIKDGFSQITTESFGVEMWPDTAELTNSERCPTDLHYPAGDPAYLYSAVNPTTVLRHFQWMSEYGIDGVFLQRFGGQLFYPEIREQRNRVTSNILSAAEAYGRVWAMMYDVTGMNESDADLVQTLEQDWKYLVDVMKITDSPAYLHHNGLPVLAIWGLGFFDRPGTPEEAAQLVDFFENNPNPRYRVTLVGGVPFWWRTLELPSAPDAAWADYYCSLDVISPWAVGAFTTDAEVDGYATTLLADMARAKECGAEFMPVVFPGIAMHSQGGRPFNENPRRGGRLYWRQVFTALSAGSTMIYNAMFDEVNEATAMYKLAATAADAPVGLEVITLDADGDCLPNDWYLRLAGEATKMLRGEIPLVATIPITPPPSPTTCQANLRIRLRLRTTSDWTTVSLEGLEVKDVQIVSSSVEAAEASFQPDDNFLVLTQTIEEANTGQSVEIVADAYLAPFTTSTFFVTIGRGNLGATNVDFYAVSGGDAQLVHSLEWSGLGSDGQNLVRFEVPTSLFVAAP